MITITHLYLFFKKVQMKLKLETGSKVWPVLSTYQLTYCTEIDPRADGKGEGNAKSAQIIPQIPPEKVNLTQNLSDIKENARRKAVSFHHIRIVSPATSISSNT